MKGKGTKGQQFFFKDEWEAAVMRLLLDNGYSSVERVNFRSNTILTYYPTGNVIAPFSYRTEPMPIFVQKWIESHPQPTMNHNEFIHSLGERVLVLEAALAQKGGRQ